MFPQTVLIAESITIVSYLIIVFSFNCIISLSITSYSTTPTYTNIY